MDFIYKKPASITEALSLKAVHKDNGAFIAGGTDLLVDMKKSTLRTEPRAIIDISGLEEISYIRQEDGQIKIGAGTRISEILKSPIVQRNAPLLFQAARQFANPLIKNRATLGGNLINASPAADMATPLLVLEAEVVLKSVNAERVASLEQFFSGVKRTTHRDDELLAEVRFNEAPGKECEFLKMGQRNGTAIAIASLSLMFDMSNGIIKNPGVALGSVAPVPLRAHRTESALDGVEPSGENIKQAGDILTQEVKPITDIRGSAEYRREMAGMLLLMAFGNLGYGLGEY